MICYIIDCRDNDTSTDSKEEVRRVQEIMFSEGYEWVGTGKSYENYSNDIGMIALSLDYNIAKQILPRYNNRGTGIWTIRPDNTVRLIMRLQSEGADGFGVLKKGPGTYELEEALVTVIFKKEIINRGYLSSSELSMKKIDAIKKLMHSINSIKL